MNLLKLIMIPVFLICGCSSTYVIKNTHRETSDLNWKIHGEECEIVINEKENITARNMCIIRDSLYCIDATNDNPKIIHLSSINEIKYANNTKGAFWGAGIGALIGLSAIAINPEVEKEGGTISFGGALIIGALAGSFYGSGLGAILGYEETYKFESIPPDTSGFKQ